MYLTRRAGNVLRGLLQAYGPKSIKKSLWNAEFSRGRWACLESSPDDDVYPYIERYANNASILDLGCGSGSTGNELDIRTYQSYVGVDISDVAIGQARTRTAENGRAEKNRYFQSDIFSYAPDQLYDVILFRDSIYYIPTVKITTMLERYSKYLKESGVFVVRMWSASGKYKCIVETIEQSFDVLDRHTFDQPETNVLVFRKLRRP